MTSDGRITDEKIIRNTDTEKWCQSMIESVICYRWTPAITAGELLEMELVRRPSYLAKYVEMLGEARVREMICETIELIDHIKYNTYTDSEGCTYNSIIWKE